MSLTLHQKLEMKKKMLEMIKLSEEVILKAKIGYRLSLLSQTVSQVVNVKGKF